MKIVMVHNTYQQPGGEDASFRNARDLLKSAGHEIVEYLRSNDEAKKFVSLGQLALAKRTIWAGDTRREFRELLEREMPDIVHVQNTFVMISPSIYWACRDANVPIVQVMENYRLLCPGGLLLRDGKVCEECMEHGVWRSVRYGCYRQSSMATAVVAAMLATHRLLGTWSRVIDYYLVPTNFGRRKFIEGGLPPEKLLVKPNFVYPDPGEGHGERTYALYVGRLSPEKGLRTLLSAWAGLGTPIPLDIVGDGPMREELEAYARQSALSNVRFRGNLKRDQVMMAMKGARCLLFPGECYEGLPHTVLEAFACGTPVIASRMGAAQEVVLDGSVGVQFTPGDVKDLTSKTEWAWAHPARLAEMGREARREFEAKYTAERNYEILMAAYQRAIANHAPEPATIEAGLARPAQPLGIQ
jgi:glycosyltransferase involved in cell wall biosynthesis